MTDIVTAPIITECNLLANDIPSIAAALSDVKSQILNASILLPQLQEAFVCFENVIQNSNYVEDSVHYETTALKQSAYNLALGMSEIQERMISLEIMLSKSTVIPPTLSTADDISTAFHIAVNGPETTLSCPDIGWSFAEAVLERFSFLWTKELETVGNRVNNSFFGKAVWRTNNFDSNMVKLLNGGDCWRLRKSLE
jgi:hypothetical protein